MNKKYSINFHNTFLPDLDYIGRILETSEEINMLSKEEIFTITGIPAAKVEAHILYGNYMGLYNHKKESSKYTLVKTRLGELISHEDPYFQEDITKYICNYFLTSKYTGADMWFQIARKLQQNIGHHIKVEVVENELKKVYGLDRIPVLGPFNGTYVSKSSLRDINLLYVEDNKYKFNKHFYNDEYIYMYIYTLLSDLYMLDDNRREFTMIEICEQIYWGRAFGWDENQVLDCLEKLEEMKFLKINKQLTPLTIIIKVNREDVLGKIYSMLM